MAIGNPFTSAQAAQTMQALPPDLAVQQAQVTRQQQLADLLRKQSLDPSGGTEVVNGWAVRKSPLEGLAKLAQGLGANFTQTQADKRQGELTQEGNKQLVEGLQKYQSLLQGTPEQTTPAVMSQGPWADPARQTEVTPATTTPGVPGNKQAALAALLQSGHPMLQQMGVAQLTAKPESMFNKIDPKDFTQASVAKFAATQNYADLVPERKREFVNGQAVDAYGVAPGTVIPKQVDMASDLLVPDGKGGFVPNTGLVGVKKDIAKSGASNVNVKTDVKMGESLGQQVGPMMKDSTAAAEGAVKQVDAAQRIVKAVDSNKIFAGPGAGAKMTLTQIADGLGVTGADEKEKIANTRTAIRGLAELTLQGRQQMRGQGAITESEGALATKAMSGDITDLTAAEVKMLAKASERAARFNYAEHQRKMKVMEANPSLQGIAPFYQGPAMPPEAAPPVPAGKGGAKFLGFE